MSKAIREKLREEFVEKHRPLQHRVEEITGWKDHVWHIHKGEPSVYHYQQKCRHKECRSKNRLYYHERRKKLTEA